jgi:hypothetical protein
MQGNVSMRPNYEALSSQLALINPSPTFVDHYEFPNTALSSCSKLQWRVKETNTVDGSVATRSGESATDLPYLSSARVCSCMMESLECVSNKTDPHDTAMQDRFCGSSIDAFHCSGVLENFTTGVYGTYATCMEAQKDSWILNQVFISKGRDPAICTSSNGTMQTPVPSKSRSPDCETFLRQAGPDATGKVTFTPSTTPLNISKMNNTLAASSKVGIGVGITIFVVLLAVIAIRAYARSKGSKEAPKAEDYTFEKAELSTHSEKPKAIVVELGSSERHELEGITAHEIGGEMRVEVDSDAQIHELGSTGNEIVKLDNNRT